jgi:hypothetical protein
MFALCVSLRPVVVAAMLALCCFTPAKAQDLSFGLPLLGGIDEVFAGRIETSNGIDATSAALSAYSSAVIAPFGPLHQDGLRLKLYGSYGSWSYSSKRVFCALSPEEMKKLAGVNLRDQCNALANRVLTPQERKTISDSVAPFGLQVEGDSLYFNEGHRVIRYDAAVMPGWQASGQDFALKAYLGPAMETRQNTFFDADKTLNGMYWGAKTAIEGWVELGDSLWLTADSSYFTGTQAYSAALRIGYRATSWLTVGPEAAAFGDEDDDSTRAGGFLSFTLGGVETTLSGGISADYDGTRSPYGQAGVYKRF